MYYYVRNNYLWFLYKSNKDKYLFIVWLLLLVFPILTINYIRWQVNGEEVLCFTDQFILIENRGTIFKNRLKIDYTEVERITSDDDKSSNSSTLWGLGDGKIKIHFLGKQKRFGKDLSLREAKRMASLMNKELEKRKAK